MTNDYLAQKFQSGQGQQFPEPTWNPGASRYEFHTPRGILCVDGDTYSEAEEQAKQDHPVSDSVSAQKLDRALDELNDWTVWEQCVDGERVYWLEKRMGRPSQGRNKRIQALVTSEVYQWIEQQKIADESMSDVIFRILKENIEGFSR